MATNHVLMNKRRYNEYSENYSKRNISPVVIESYQSLVDKFKETPNTKLKFDGKSFGFKRCSYVIDSGLLYVTKGSSKFYITYYDKDTKTFIFENKNKLAMYTTVRNLLRQQRATGTNVFMFSDEFKFDEFCRKYTPEQKKQYIQKVLLTQTVSNHWGDVYDIQ
jgi:hypothetical protein